jgi:hypothetical protein
MPPIRILSDREPYIRAGHHHRRKADYPDDHFTAEELEIFRADPLLTVVNLGAADDARVPGGAQPPEVVVPPAPVAADAPVPASTDGTPPTLAEVINTMDRDDPQRTNQDWWTKAGKPEVAFLESVLDADVSAAERDAAWAAQLESGPTE